MNRWMQCLLCCVLSAFVLVEAALIGEAAELRKTENIIFVMTDGLRWQEMFGGVDAAILNEPNNVEKSNLGALKKQFCRETPEASREARLYRAMAGPVFSATTPLEATTKHRSPGNGIVASSRTGL